MLNQCVYSPHSMAFFHNTFASTQQNKFIMVFGLVAATACFGYLYYWNHSQRTNPNSPTYVAVNEDDTLTIRKRSSRWN